MSIIASYIALASLAKRARFGCLHVLGMFLFFHCLSPAVAQTPGGFHSYTTTGNSLTIDAGDLLDVQVLDALTLSAKYRVDEDGRIALLAGEPVHVGGLSAAGAGLAIAEMLRRTEIMYHPTVTVFVLEYATQGITLLGEVRNPGTYTLLGPHTLYDALSVAGGPTANEGATITITHAHAEATPVTIDVASPNYSAIQRATMVRPGDTIMVSKADVVYVVGDVGKPGAFFMQNGAPLTVLNMIALAQGVNRTAAMAHGAVIRATSSGAVTLRFDLDKVMKNMEPNIALRANDIVVIPRSGLKTFMTTALPGASAAVTSAVATALIVR